MDRQTSELPEAILLGYQQVLSQRLVEIVEPLAVESYKGSVAWAFRCLAPVPVPNAEGLPDRATLKVVVRSTFPYSAPDVFAEGDFSEGFPHQDAETGKLCLLEDRLAPRGPLKLACHLSWAVEWLADAAQGALLKPGEPYELPDFSRKQVNSEAREPLLIFAETAETLKLWLPYIDSLGVVECAEGKLLSAIAVSRFRVAESVLFDTPISGGALDAKKISRGRWILLSDIRWKRHRLSTPG